nr:PREDICTED: disintegrin and metalloproteinase domain-containing protein 8 [Latimeria chalumnae]|eukprot:XP_014348496.1 PREDICTED: disintegrin and metalloproteinase domain-containing protein 8 [Latimeria chalumnae]
MHWIFRRNSYLFFIYFFGCVWSSWSSHPLSDVERYEVVQPRRLTEGRRKRDLSSTENPHPDKVHYAISLEGTDYIVHLEKNRGLLGDQYSETYYLENGTEVTERPVLQSHCFYHGEIQNVTDSSASIHTCSGIRGFLQVKEQVYLIEPLEGSEDGKHAVYRAEHLRAKQATCGVSNETLYDYGPKMAALFNPSHWKSAPLAKSKHYVEMYLVVDNAEYIKYDRNLEKVRRRMMEITNHVDKLYRTLNFRVALVGLEVWAQGDKFQVSSDSDKTLTSFIKWRNNDLLKRKKHDNAQLVTGVDFDGTTVGLATKFAMCTDKSAAVNEDHSTNALGVASTIAHEMGHNLGMSHDEDLARCFVAKTSGGCVMAPSVGATVNKNCSVLQECTNPCCNATTCRLKVDAVCADGECCHNCQFKQVGEVCRSSNGDCDLTEYCSGSSGQCPQDAFQMNGVPCKNGNGYCYNGECPSHSQHCLTLWGAVTSTQEKDQTVVRGVGWSQSGEIELTKKKKRKEKKVDDSVFLFWNPTGAKVAPDICFEENQKGNKYLYCRRTRNGFEGCRKKDVKCGKLHCTGGNEFPITNSRYTITPYWGGKMCKLAEMTGDVTGDTKDLGLVPNGTKCGEGMVCRAGQCLSLSIYGSSDCSAKCNNRGVCNHKMECHCDPGWAPPYCDRKDSTIPKGGNTLIIAIVAAIVALLLVGILLAGGFMYYNRRNKKEENKIKVKSDSTSGLSNPLFQENRSNGSPQVGRPQISGPQLLNSVTVPSIQDQSDSFCVTVIPTRPPPQPPKTAQVVKPNVPPPPVPPVKPGKTGPTPLQARPPPPPSKPLPELKTKPTIKHNLCPPVPPVKPASSTPASHPNQMGHRPKVALKPPVQLR